jgi:hypothetical protein
MKALVMNRTLLFSVLCAGAMLAGLPAIAKDKPGKAIKSPKAEAEGTRNGSGSVAQRSGETASSNYRDSEPLVRAEFGFSDAERAQIHQYVENYPGQSHGKARQLPPGLAKKVARGESLPPGWQKKCLVGQPMPPEVFEHCRPLPPDLVMHLPPPPEPTITVVIGGKVVRLLQATREILDVFDVHVRL